MKEAMFEGKEVLDKMLADADEANLEPEEILAREEARKVKEATEEMKNIMNGLKETVEGNDEANNDTQNEDHVENNNANGDIMDEASKDNKNNIDDENNNASGDKMADDVIPPKKEILTFDDMYNKSTSEKATNTETAYGDKMETSDNDTTSMNSLVDKR